MKAPEKLEAVLRPKRKLCMIGAGPMSDPYIHLGSRLSYHDNLLRQVRTLNNHRYLGYSNLPVLWSPHKLIHIFS
ncbi:MAG: hypothetical protein PWP48_840 [Clostridiales bacterium]|nr:hypothetical protein [Clostridiales bacterium]